MHDIIVHMSDVNTSNFKMNKGNFTITNGDITVESHMHQSIADAPDYCNLTIKNDNASSELTNLTIDRLQLDLLNNQIDITFSTPHLNEHYNNISDIFTSQGFTIDII
ncbi:hypothetical protein HL033_01595 [Neoehrlichia mikurensis]|uniref:Uncharacterized protein n=1 Tax=Neoehrlichia mikurensis TaxID=89586 RepID=A0A9Q9F433_9RICK|nr:hypothetical protein [Neoehrlichia mikurensis]QXK92236.1 hypothetical protein IAH97_01590 [Neoehrlichia mikurensis]QXK92691.1 hypothetical protein HUN61_01585 [Neoehrlichia mikurensis]QXK93929.1 hypothetical protein HL033_01595 [Neoehrlichia mikurensis]UTO55910.1 hypothetical protein LUA82_02520 [Neoehrlichia mikurensis]UTO56826.1 hypothetical protein LUA81_02500 [Neoehrlichia mikurensis]